MQAYIRNEAYYDKKPKASKLKQRYNVYVLRLKADYQWTYICSRENSMNWSLPRQKLWPRNQYLVRKVETNQILFVLSMIHARTSHDKRTNLAKSFKPDHEVSIQHSGD